jgi:D-tyrosyl-tRNA(Tyr) deacylase
LVLLGVEVGDTEEDLEWLAGKLVRLRVFPDDEGRMNRSLTESGGDLMVVSQFTLLASTRKGNRPSWDRAAGPDEAEGMYRKAVARLQELMGRTVATGEFGAHMEVALVNDGPVTLVIDSRWKE